MHHDVIKPRDIREKLRGKIDPEVGKVLVRLAEDSIQTRMMLAEVVKHLSHMASIVNALTQGTDKLRQDLASNINQLSRTHGGVDSEDVT